MTITISPVTIGALVNETAMAPVTLVAAGGTAPYTYTIAAQNPSPNTFQGLSFANPGALPNGLKLDSATGVISGTPITAGDYFFIVAAEDSLGVVGWLVVSGNVARNPAANPQNLDYSGSNNMVLVTVRSRIAGHPETGRMTVSIGGFNVVLQGGDTFLLPKHMVAELRRDKVIV